MKNRSIYAVLTRFGIIGAVLATLVLIAPVVSAADPLEYDYPENGTDAVAEFSATDADGDEIKWSLSGVDKDDFTIEGGVLAFKKSPDYEGATDRDEIPEDEQVGEQNAGDNVYKIIVEASGGSQPVEVTVTNEDEPGSVDFTRPQPQVSREIIASFDDDDGEKEPSWQWSMGPSMEGPWTEISGQTKANRNPTADEVGSYLRATVSYTDSFGAQTASGVTERPVEDRTLANAAPEFGDIDPIGIEENMTGSIGDPVTASDDDNDVLLYDFGALKDADGDDIGNDNDLFNIAERTGQLSVKGDDGIDFETPGDDPATGIARAETTTAAGDIPEGVFVYNVVITATDPSGAPGTGRVAVYVRDANEPPAFGDDAKAQTTLYVNEGGTSTPDIYEDADATDTVDSYGTDADDEDSEDDNTVTFALEGAPAETFEISAGGVLSVDTDFRANFEGTPEYSLVVIAQSGAEDDGRDMYTRLGVTVKVVDQEDDGTVEISALEPQVGSAVIATLKEEDKDITGVVWQWFRGGAQDAEATVFTALVENDATRETNLCDADNLGSDASPCVIDGGTGPVYTPVAADATGGPDGAGLFIHALATYTDGLGDTADNASGAPVARVQVSDPANTAPKFPDQDLVTAGDQSDSTNRSVPENDDSATVGDPVTAGDGNGDRLLYSLGGDDASMFKIDRVSGQISTTAKLNFEADDEHTVVVTATDPSGSTDSIMVVIAVTDENDNPVISGVEEVSVDEGTTDVATFTATDEDGDDIEWTLDGVDKAAFEIGEDTGVLTFKDAPNFEAKADMDEDMDSLGNQGKGDNIFQVTVKANAGSHKVAVTVTNVNEDGSVDFDQPQPQATRNLKASFSDQDGEKEPTWQWAMGPTADGPWTDIAGATMSARKPTAGEAGSYLRATVTYTDSFGEQMASGVTENPVEGRTLANAAPTFKDDIVIEISENTSGDIGDPVLASDGDNDELLYDLVTRQDGQGDDIDNDNTMFDIGERSGQLSVKNEDGFDYEASTKPATVAADATDDIPEGAKVYTVSIEAKDPSRAPGYGVVMVAVTDANEAPEFTTNKDRKTLYVIENTGADVALRADMEDDSTPVTDAYGANDEDGDDTAAINILEGDKDGFGLTDGVLSLDTGFSADYEDTPSYSLTLVASTTPVDRVKYARLNVTVKVVNAEDRGTVEINAREPQVGRPVVATLDDKDDGVTGVSWKWYRGGEVLTDAASVTALDARPACTAADADSAVRPSATDACEIGSAAGSALYTPGADDVDWLLHAVATYTDMIENEDRNTDADIVDLTELAGVSSEYAAQTSDPANTAPVFPDQDLNAAGDQSDMATRSVAENDEGASVGEPVSAGDRDGDALMYSLSGDDADLFNVTNTGLITTAVELDYEALPEDAKYHMVTLMAQDPSGAYDMIMVQINVTDADDGAIIVDWGQPRTRRRRSRRGDGDVHGLREHADDGHGSRDGHGHGRRRRHADVLGRLDVLRCRRHGQHHDDDDAGPRGDGQSHGDGHGVRR